MKRSRGNNQFPLVRQALLLTKYREEDIKSFIN